MPTNVESIAYTNNTTHLRVLAPSVAELDRIRQVASEHGLTPRSNPRLRATPSAKVVAVQEPGALTYAEAQGLVLLIQPRERMLVTGGGIAVLAVAIYIFALAPF